MAKKSGKNPWVVGACLSAGIAFAVNVMLSSGSDAPVNLGFETPAGEFVGDGVGQETERPLDQIELPEHGRDPFTGSLRDPGEIAASSEGGINEADRLRGRTGEGNDDEQP